MMVWALLLCLQEKIEMKEYGSFYLAHRPSAYADTKAWPVIVELHGDRGSVPGWKEAAEGKGYVLVQPFSRGASWGTRKAASDTAFVLACLEDAKTRWLIDPERVLLTGFAEGANYACELAASRAEAFAACAPVHCTGVRKVREGMPWMVVAGRRTPRLEVEGAGDLSFRESERPGRPECEAVLDWFAGKAKPRGNVAAVEDFIRQARHLDASLVLAALVNRGAEPERVRFLLQSLEALGVISLGKVETDFTARRYVDAVLRCRQGAVQYAWLPVGEKFKKRLATLESDPRVKKALEAGD